MDLDKLAKILSDQDQPKFRLGQIKKAIYQDGVSLFSEITTLSKELRELLDKKIKILSFVPKERIDDVIVLDPGNLDRPIGLNMLEFDEKDKRAVWDALFELEQKRENIKKAKLIAEDEDVLKKAFPRCFDEA